MIKVPAEIIWLPSVNHSLVAKHFKELLGAELLIEDESLHASEEEEESYITIFGTLKMQESCFKMQESYFNLQVSRWCRQEVSRHQMYLSLPKKDMVHLSFPSDSNHTLDDKWIDIENMSFGTMVGLNKFAEHYSVMDRNKNKEEPLKVAKIKAYFQHDIKLMSVYFHVAEKNVKPSKRSAATHRPHRFEYPYSAVEKILINKIEKSKSTDVYFYISHPPLIYMVEEKPEDAENKFYQNYIYQSPDTTYTRVDTFANCSHSDIGLSTILKLQFSSATSWNAICNFLLNSEKTKYYFSPILPLPKKNSYQNPKIKEDQFSCIYALQTILSRSREVVVQIDDKQEISTVNANLNKFAKENPRALEAALFEILSFFERRKLVNFSKALIILYSKYNNMINSNESTNKSSIRDSLSVPKNMIEVRRAVLTPTRIIFLPPQPYFKCCFFRKFQAEYTIRLSVKDDDITSLSFTLFGRPKVRNEPNEQNDASGTANSSLIENNNSSVESHNNLKGEDKSEDSCSNVALKKVKKELLKGFKIGQRHYEWLGCSTSHFREHGVLYYAKMSNNNNAAKAREMLGNFDKVRNIPSKYMARLGQVFSQSLDYITVKKSKTIIEKDIPDTDNRGYIFSDGIGKISPSLAQEIFRKMNVKHNPSAIQIRYAGCKGMLTQWAGLEHQIVFRSSMEKFKSDCEYLDVLKVSKPRLVYLNRPFITILTQLGVPDEVFLDLQNNNLEHHFKSLVCENIATATLHVHSALRVDYKRIHNAGINVLQEPFFCSMIKNIFQQHLVKLTKKARILIPEDKGRTMFGVLDETQTLEYGQVFVQYTEELHNEEESAKTVVLNNEIVLVTKNPCMHPGDVRKFLAVDVEALHHIKDCIVFPAKGHRPHPDEMAGSDLDGDEYSVIWAKELIFPCDNYDPMDFPSGDAAKLEKKVEVKEMVDFFCEYISAGQVGQIATAHLVWADHDSEEGGIFTKRCKDLASKYSVALDFAKSGKVERLSMDERPSIYPDYMDKGLLSDTYISKNVLGQLYRCSKTVLLGFEGLICTSAYEADEDLNYPGHENYKESAKDALSIFNHEVDTILQQYGIESEGELFSGAILKTSKYICMNQDLNDLTVIEYRIKKLFKETQRKFCSEFSNTETNQIPPLITLVYDKWREQVFQKASAWYMVTCEQSGGKKRHFGFPWTVYEILYELKKERGKINLSTSPNKYEERMNDIVMKNYQGEINNGNTTNVTNESAEVKKMAFKIICDWMSKQPFITENDKDEEEYDYLIRKIYDEVTDELGQEDVREEQSVFKTVLRYLHKLSLLLFKRDVQCRRSHNSHFLQQQIIGLLAFKTLLNLLFRHEFNPSSFIEEDMESHEEVFRIPLNEESVFKCIIHRRDEFIELLKEWTKVEEVEFRAKPDRRKKWFLLFTVKGNKYALHHFQDVIFQDNFLKAVKRLSP